MFVRNTWYVAAWDAEVTDKPLARTILGKEVVLYRTSGGQVVALEDRCPHRHLPLSQGFLEGDTLVCGYHGMRFDPTGQCIRIPGQTRIPDAACVRAYPIVERWGWVWIWMGDADKADPSTIVAIPQFDAPGWSVARGERMYFTGNYQLMTDNLLDPSHVSYVHRANLGNGAEAELPVETVQYGDVVTVSRIVPNTPPPAFFQPFGNFTGNVDRWQVYTVALPSMCIVDTGIVATGPLDSIDLAAADPAAAARLVSGTERKTVQVRGYDFMTPETETTSHYFWFLIRNFGVDDDAVGRQFIASATIAFREDLVVVEAIQRETDKKPARAPLTLGLDKGSVLARRRVKEMIAAETAGATTLAG